MKRVNCKIAKNVASAVVCLALMLTLSISASSHTIPGAEPPNSIRIGIIERFREVIGNQQGKVGIVCITLGIIIAVSVDSNDTVGVFTYHNTVRVHTEGSHHILKFLCFINDF